MEADGLRWALLIIGSLVIVGLAVHGIWLSRKNSEKPDNSNKQKNDQEYQPSGWQPDTDSFGEEVNDTNDEIDEELNIKFDMGIDDVTKNDALDLADSTLSENDYDDLGLGAVRVVSSHPNPYVEAEPEQSLSKNTPVEPEVTSSTSSTSSKVYASVVTQPKPEYSAKYTLKAAKTVAITPQERATSNNTNESPIQATQQFSGGSNSLSSNDNYQAPEPPPFLLKKEAPVHEGENDSNIASNQVTKPNTTVADEQKEAPVKSLTASLEKLSLSEQARNLVKRKKNDSAKKRCEPKIATDQIHIDFDDQPVIEPESKENLKAQPKQPQEVLVLNVKSADDNPILGAALLPMLLTLGFKFGEQDIFHRHVNSNGKGPVLFSLANMFKPGDFDIDNLENFTTQGISLFMILPIEGEPHQVFNMMHNAARKIADEFSAQIYDGRRTLLTKQSLQQYVEKIREFERQRLLRG